jgi:uncharacterized protein
MKYLSILLLFIAAPMTQAASFDCSRASTKIENTICGDVELSRLDEELSSAYKSALASLDAKKSVTDSQREWLSKERSTCDQNAKNVSHVTRCLKNVYKQRLFMLRSMSTPMKKTLGLYTKKVQSCYFDPSSEGPVCEGYVDDKISVTESAGSIKVDMELNFFNGHMCEFDGNATWQDGHLIAKGEDPETKCIVELYSDGNEILSAVNSEMFEGCSHYCGARGSLEGARAKKVR